MHTWACHSWGHKMQTVHWGHGTHELIVCCVCKVVCLACLNRSAHSETLSNTPTAPMDMHKLAS